MLFQTDEAINSNAGEYLFGWGLFLIIFGAICVILLIVFTEFKRKERDTIKFTAIVIILASFSLGFGIDMILNFSGFW